ncbi:MAG: hypothetical protein L0K69_11960 [Enterobacterales bacterium]|nr:hypothetical protein [Enterobacterales bacterium]
MNTLQFTLVRENMVHDVSAALAEFTQRFIDNWQRESGDFPSSEALYGVE